MFFKILKFSLIVQFCFNSHIFPATCERIICQKTEILKYNSNHSINVLTLEKENSTQNEQLRQSDWFSNIPLLPIAVATSNSIPEGPCKTQLRLFLNHLKNGTLWAVEMFDSSAKYPYGIFDGLNRYLGSFDQCNRIQTIVSNGKENNKFEEIRSKYCLVDIKYKKNDEVRNLTKKYDFVFDPQGSAWEALRESENIGRYQRNILQMALCFPEKCRSEDIIAALKEPLEKINAQFNFQVDATIHPEYCHENHGTYKFSNYDIAYCLFVGVIIGLVVISTILETKSIQHDENDYCFSRRLLACFSARRNLVAIFKVKYNNNAFDCMHLIRCIFASITIFQHRNLELMQGGNITGSYYEIARSKPFLGIIYNFDVEVDGFFGLAGIALSYYLLEFLENSKGLKIFPLIFKRFIRLVPLYIFMMFAYAFLIHHLGSGPFWESRLGCDRDVCSSNWWNNLLFIYNYIDGKNIFLGLMIFVGKKFNTHFLLILLTLILQMLGNIPGISLLIPPTKFSRNIPGSFAWENLRCIPQSWYLAVDFQCYIIGLLLIGAFHKMSRKNGYIFLVCTLILSVAIPFYVTYNNNVDPFIKFDLRVRKLDTLDYFRNYYIKTHMRLSAYFVGVIMGSIIYDCKLVVWRLSKFWSHVLFILQVVTLPLLFQWLGSYFIDENLHPTYLFVKALYASLHRPIFAFSVCSIFLLITIGQGLDFYYKLLTPRWIQPFSRLSYAMFLTHFVVQSYELGIARTAFTYSTYNMIKNYIGDIVYISLLSLVVVILIEKPFKNLEKLLLANRKSTKAKMSLNLDKKEE